jgi:phosphohistidine phosphatase
MKTLIVIRHAKSSWDDPSLPDFQRPLNERGKKDAPKMAERIFARGIHIDAFISSPAKRAKKTAELFAEKFGVKKSDIILVPALYEASEGNFYEVISNLSSKSSCIALFSHNPGITDFVSRLTEVRVDNMPTCAVFAVKTDIDQWDEFQKANKEFFFFDFPKSIHDD